MVSEKEAGSDGRAFGVDLSDPLFSNFGRLDLLAFAFLPPAEALLALPLNSCCQFKLCPAPRTTAAPTGISHSSAEEELYAQRSPNGSTPAGTIGAECLSGSVIRVDGAVREIWSAVGDESDCGNTSGTIPGGDA